MTMNDFKKLNKLLSMSIDPKQLITSHITNRASIFKFLKSTLISFLIKYKQASKKTGTVKLRDSPDRRPATGIMNSKMLMNMVIIFFVLFFICFATNSDYFVHWMLKS